MRVTINRSIITCECGFQILVIGDVRAMTIAVENHVLEHKNKGFSEEECDRLSDSLIAMVFNKIIENNQSSDSK